MRNRHLTLINFYVIFKPIFGCGVTTNSGSSIGFVQGLIVNLLRSVILILKKLTDSIAIKVATLDYQFMGMQEHYLELHCRKKIFFISLILEFVSPDSQWCQNKEAVVWFLLTIFLMDSLEISCNVWCVICVFVKSIIDNLAQISLFWWVIPIKHFFLNFAKI